ncbi:VOC family protein [Geminicoccaceae bacterium 1502E]|nr:VOC family protein [Geminicoccaceae bacterium 1502E]
MLKQIKGLHHVTALAGDARRNNDFFTRVLGLRRVKKTVNFDAPDVYHLYYGDETGSPGTVMTSFPFPRIVKGSRGAGEVVETAFAVPAGTLGWWKERLEANGVPTDGEEERFGDRRLRLAGPEGEGLALVEVPGDPRAPFARGPVPAEKAVRGFHGVTLRLHDGTATGELLHFMGCEEVERGDALTRYAIAHGNGAHIVDIEVAPGSPPARQGAGSVHHVAFAVEDEAAQLEVRQALLEAGFQVTPPIDRDYFRAIYFRTPGGVLFEVATNGPGFARDEEPAHLGKALRIPAQHAHLRERLERSLPPIRD